MRPVTIYTTRLCMFCFAAKRMLSHLRVDYDEIRLDGKPELRRKLSMSNGGWRTVPMVFVGDHFVGGYDDLRTLHARGELVSMVRAASRANEGS